MTDITSTERTISITQAMAVVGVSRRTIYNWLKAGKLRYRRTVGGTVRIYEGSLWASDSAEKVQPSAKLDTSSSN